MNVQTASRRIAAGGVVLDIDRRHLYIVLPSNNFGPWTLPKGGVDPGETVEQAAVREVREESGVSARILGYLGMFPDSISDNHYFLMVRVGPVGAHDDETETVARTGFDSAYRTLAAAGNFRDAQVVERAWRVINEAS